MTDAARVPVIEEPEHTAADGRRIFESSRRIFRRESEAPGIDVL